VIAAVSSILREIGNAGFATSVHLMRNYVELRALPLVRAEVVHVARVDGHCEIGLFSDGA
jgi:hypothetical protein